MKFYKQRGLRPATFFAQETFGADKLVAGPGAYERDESMPLEETLRETPLSDLARQQIVQIETAKIDYMPGLSHTAKGYEDTGGSTMPNSTIPPRQCV